MLAAVWSTPASGEFEFEQPEWSAFTGQTWDELKGWGWLDAIHPDDRPETARVWTAALANRDQYIVEHHVRRKEANMTRIQLMPRWAAATAIVVGCLVLAGWVSDVEFLKRVLPGLVAMNPATAVAFMLAGLALWLLQVEESRLPSRRAAQAGAGIVAMIGLLKLCALLGGPDVHMDQWLFPTKLAEAGSALPNRMAPNTALNFLLLGCALLLLGAKSRRGAYLCQLCTLAITLTASLAIIGYAFDSRSFYRVGPFIPMALHTALCFLALAAGILAGQPNKGITAIFMSRGMGGTVARRLLPEAILVPIVLGWLCLEGERIGFYGITFGVALMVTMIIFVFLALIGWTAVALESADAERRLADEALYKNHEFLQAVLENTAEGIVACDAEGQLTFFNRATREFHGLPQESLPADQWPEYYSLYMRDGITPMQKGDVPLFKALNGAHVRDTEMVIAPREGSRRFLIASGEPLFDAAGEKLGAVAVMHDITERKQAEEALRVEIIERQMAMDSLRESYGVFQRTKEEAVQAREEADTANLAKSEFLSRMSHELRTPMNAILGFGQILDSEDLTPLQKESVGHVLKGGRHLLSLINEVLDIARVEAGHDALSVEPIALDDVVPDACALVRPLAAERNIDLDHDLKALGGSHVLADRQRLKQVLINLLSNAIKYNHLGGQVVVSCHQMPDERMCIAVRDTGPGIAAEDLPKLFVPFDRLGATNSDVEGTGLGLVLSQRLVTAMGGTLKVESIPGQGSTFSIELPQATAPEAALAHLPQDNFEAGGREPSQRQYSILCIEDNLSNLRLIEVVLARRPGVTLLSAMQGSVGLDMARQHEPDLILLDLHLPDIGGSEVLTRLRQSALTRDIPVIVISADATPAQVERLLEAGVLGYLTKPLDVTEFLRLLDGVLQKIEDAPRAEPDAGGIS